MPPLIDLTGQRFGRLTVIERDESKAYKKPHWKCKCDCGNIVTVYAYSLRSGATQSCGCLHKERTSEASMKDMTGKKFGKLTVLKRNDAIYGKGTHAQWICQCECGNIISCTGESLRNGQVSCGCAKSTGEFNIQSILTSSNIKFKREVSFDDLVYVNKLRYDFAILDDDGQIIRLIEFDGNQHNPKNNRYTPDVGERDALKNNYAIERNIPLVRIPYKERDHMTLEMLLGDQYLYRKE